ncbi:MerR family transcriptional regulator [Actinokineospora diospyrosa]|uniref:DNA-binding transcriptional regulator, MerR family n=1 Tax=Actinokineospora diospyrosa TaxID=103728 RepID=A0ABT1I9L6_9PSEU|nr:MerR family transcriptional regulator [Actinokineospora diospyrosa]MCP2269322.1 DNA-binding transcriptional regulator, MerR family [Actinokineospora diospyrosa]
MPGTIPIGEFAKMTHLTVKALRHYHRLGLLEPRRVDPHTGLRMYDSEQVTPARTIRRLRELDMPLADIKAVLGAAGTDDRDRVLLAHLDHLEGELERTRVAIAGLRRLLEGSASAVGVQYRVIPDLPAVGLTRWVQRIEVGRFCEEAFAALPDDGTGPLGALFPEELFTEGAGEVTAFRPVSAVPATLVIPGAMVAVAVHRGRYEDLDETYGPLGAHVAARGLAVAGPLREIYFDPELGVEDRRTEVCWPLSRIPE